MYLTRTAGIETRCRYDGVHAFVQCILPALRELKHIARQDMRLTYRMYLTRTAGIETTKLDTYWNPDANVSYPHCGN